MDVALKQRMVGATVLIAAAVIVLPMLLSGRPEQAAQESQKIELPPQPAELDFQTRRYPIGETPAADSRTVSPASDPSPGSVAHVELEPRDFEDALQGAETPDTGADAAAAPTPGPAASGDGISDTGEEASRVASRPEPSALSPQPEGEPAAAAPTGALATAGGGRYVVQVASFGSLVNANRMSTSLQDHGYAVLSDTVDSDVGTLHRVRIGPFQNQAAANQALSRVRQQFDGVKPRLVDLQPETSAQVTAPSDPLVRWVVQVGSFSSTGNADKLVERLRGDGLSAYKEAVSSSGSTIYRVRVGPYVERDEAIRVDGVVKERFSLDGVVMSAD